MVSAGQAGRRPNVSEQAKPPTSEASAYAASTSTAVVVGSEAEARATSAAEPSGFRPGTG